MMSHYGADRDIPNAYEETVWDDIDALLDRYDASVRFECASACAWSRELRLTLTDPPGAPSRSMVFHTAGAPDPATAAVALVDDATNWMRESGVEPMPGPQWMRHDDELGGER